jgi:hypothetical protein
MAMEQPVAFESGGLTLAGKFALPRGHEPGTRARAIVVMHGFGGHMDGPQQNWSVGAYTNWGYATLRFDFRGCGASEGERGRVLPRDQVADAIAALDFLSGRDDVDPARIAFSGTSYGATVAVHAAGIDERAAAVIAQGGWADGESMFRKLHRAPEAWDRFAALIEKGRRHRADTGQSLWAHRYDIIPVPERLRANIDARSIFEFPTETAEETLAFNAADVAGRIAPRPFILIHSALDEVIDAACSTEIFAAAGQPAELHLISGVDHFMFGEDDQRVANLIRDWLGRYMPA